jgi:hypothetical protein
VPAFKSAPLVSRGVAGLNACAFLYDNDALVHEVQYLTETTGGSALCTGSFSRRLSAAFNSRL